MMVLVIFTRPFDTVPQSLMLSIAKGLLEVEAREKEEERVRYMAENCPPLSLSGNMQELQVQYQPV